MSNLLQAEMEEECREGWRLTDPTGSASLSARDFGHVIRYMGQNPSLPDLEQICSKYGSGSSINVDGFLKYMTASFRSGVSQEEVLDAFKVFDKDGKGMIATSEIRNIMLNLGERLEEHEVDSLMNESIGGGEGLLGYDQFVRSALGK
eukprot:TRINITY_DN8024_c0_g1_i1.p3 TRINITY_DN8024_c0_g1~~TRINITY_DN8024_c0_g1_i1.p3  ORF type:complete len:148 (-),score=67.89 TRINITY_DN8024_c0_g1_i1:72-515(-)